LQHIPSDADNFLQIALTTASCCCRQNLSDAIRQDEKVDRKIARNQNKFEALDFNAAVGDSRMCLHQLLWQLSEVSTSHAYKPPHQIANFMQADLAMICLQPFPQKDREKRLEMFTVCTRSSNSAATEMSC